MTKPGLSILDLNRICVDYARKPRTAPPPPEDSEKPTDVQHAVLFGKEGRR